MIVKQANKNEIVVAVNSEDTVTKYYYSIDSEEGQKLIKEYHLVINPEIDEF